MTYDIVSLPSKKRRTPPKRAKIASRRKKGHILIWGTPTKIWKLKKADSLFAAEIRGRDGKCLFPGCIKRTQLTCSHYFGRATKSTRFDPDNCITLCSTHHFWDKMLGWEFQKQREEIHGWDGRYTLFMKERLGKDRWETLLKRAETFISQKKAILAYQISVQNNRKDIPTSDPTN